MKITELHDFLTTHGYSYERDSEYNRDVFINSNVMVDGARTKLEIYADYYTVKPVWWYTSNKKAGTSAYLKDLNEESLQAIVQGLINSNKPKPQTFTAYSDGSGDNKNPLHPGGSAYIILDSQGNVWKKKAKGFLDTTTNRMELLAIISIVHSLPPYSTVTIYTDSQYCTKAVNIKYPGKNADQLALYHKLIQEKQLNVTLQWIKGHDGNQYNEECDQMANAEYKKMLSLKPKVEKKPLVSNHVEEAYYSCITTKGKKKRTKKKKA